MAVLAGLLALALSATRIHTALLDLLALAQSVAGDHPVAAAVLVVLFAAASAMLAFVSSAVVAPFMVYTWGWPGALLLLWGGWLLGGACAYGIGRYLGRPVVRALASPRLLPRYEARITGTLPFGLVFLFQLALPSELPGYLLGLARYGFARFLLSLGLAELPYAVAAVLLGAGIVERRIGLLISVGVAAAVLSGVAFYLLHRRLGGEVGGHTPPPPASAGASSQAR